MAAAVTGLEHPRRSRLATRWSSSAMVEGNASRRRHFYMCMSRMRTKLINARSQRVRRQSKSPRTCPTATAGRRCEIRGETLGKSRHTRARAGACRALAANFRPVRARPAVRRADLRPLRLRPRNHRHRWDLAAVSRCLWRWESGRCDVPTSTPTVCETLRDRWSCRACFDVRR